MSFKITLIAWMGILSLPVYAQHFEEKTVAGEAFEIKASSATVLEWFTLLEKRGVKLAYNSADIDLYERVTLPSRYYTPEGLLKEVLRTYDCTLKSTSSRKILIQVKGLRKVQLKGTLRNKENGEKLLGYAVTLQNAEGQRWVTLADSQGDYAVLVPPGKYTVSSSYIGFVPFMAPLDVTRDRYFTLNMQPQSTPIGEVVIQPPHMADDANYQGTPNRLSVSQHDPLAAVSFLPGVSGSLVSGNLHVNGGQRDENQVLLDGIPIYHSHHNNSLLALFNADAVRNISFYSSFIPAQYEGRLSSVTDVKLKEGDSLVHHQTVNVEMPAVSLTLDGPIVKNRLTYMVSGRHSWIDFMDNLLNDRPGLNRSFSDLTCKLAYHVNPTTSLSAVMYRSNDLLNDSTDYSINQKVIQWTGHVYALGLTTLIARKIVNTNHMGYSEYHNEVFAPTMGIDSPVFIQEGMNRLSFKSAFTMRLDPQVELSWGLKFSQEKFNLLASQDTVQNNNFHISQLSLYANTRLRLTEKLLGNVALNFVSYMPQKSPSFFSLQPRFTLKYFLNPLNTLTMDFSRMQQFYHNIALDEIPVPLDFRMPSIAGFKPSSSVHFEAGWKHVRQGWFCSLSAYYKRRSDILGLRYDMMPEEQGWHRFVMKGDAHSGGIKVRMSAQAGRWSSDLSYTYARSKEWFDDYDNGRKHPALHDIPHTLNWGTSCRVGKKSYLTLGGYIKSGYFSNLYSEDLYSDEIVRRSERSKCNYRLDFNFSSEKTGKHRKVEVYYKLGLYNIIGNPRNEEIIDLYSLETQKHCLPYFALKLAF